MPPKASEPPASYASSTLKEKGGKRNIGRTQWCKNGLHAPCPTVPQFWPCPTSSLCMPYVKLLATCFCFTQMRQGEPNNWKPREHPCKGVRLEVLPTSWELVCWGCSKISEELPTHTDHLQYLCNGRWSRIFILSYLPVDVELQREVGHPATHWSVIGGQQYGQSLLLLHAQGTDCCVFTTSIFSIVWTAKCWR